VALAKARNPAYPQVRGVLPRFKPHARNNDDLAPMGQSPIRALIAAARRDTMEFKVPKFIVAVLVLSMIAAATPSRAGSDEAFPITGTWLENQVCKGDASDPPADKRIKITATEINSSFGLCTLQDKRRKGDKITVQITCKDPGGGALTSDINFVVRDGKTLDFSDQFETYKAILYKCPE
jgi:hypothetical protein